MFASRPRMATRIPPRWGTYPTGVSPYGVHDMAGNVWEWVRDWYDANYYAVSPKRNPQGPEHGMYRVFRGGAWSSGPYHMRAAFRARWFPDTKDTVIGFRCCKSAPSTTSVRPSTWGSVKRNVGRE